MRENKIFPALLSHTYEVEINLREDWNKILNKRLENMGYKLGKGEYEAVDYFKALKKLIYAKPRSILYSKEFICPNECKKGLTLIEESITKGSDLTLFMSRQIVNLKYNDLLLNDWGIYHFHLNTEKDKDGFIKRSAWLLLAYIDETHVYFINVYHHNKRNLWTHQRMIKILHDNWPHAIEKFHLKGVLELNEKIDDITYDRLRKAGISTFVEVEKGKIYGLIGGGYATDGSSISAVRESGYWYNYLRKMELYIKENYYDFKQQMLFFDETSMNKTLKIEMLNLNDDELILLEKERMIVIKCNHINGNIRMCRLQDIIWDNE